MNNKKPVRLHKKEPLTLTYNLNTVIFSSIVLIIIYVLALSLGSENFNYLLGSCL